MVSDENKHAKLAYNKVTSEYTTGKYNKYKTGKANTINVHVYM